MRLLRYCVIALLGYWVLSSILVFAEVNKRDLSHCLIQARIHYDNSRYQEALEWWEKALAIDPNNKEALKYMKMAQKRLNKTGTGTVDFTPDEVDKAMEKALAKFSKMGEKRQMPSEPLFEKPKKELLALEEAVELGFKNHMPIQIAKEQLKLAWFKEKEAFRELFPAATIRWDETSGVVSAKDYAGRKYQVKLQHPLYHGGELRYTWEQAKVNLKITKENYEKTKEDYAVELERAYYDLVKAEKNFIVQENLLKDLEENLTMAKREHEVQASTLVEFLNVQSQYNQAYYSYLSSQNTLSLARSNFLQLLNLDRDPALNIKVDTTLAFKEHNIDLEKCIGLAYENRADLKINELGFKSAEYGEKVAKSQQLPKIDLTGTVGKAGEVFTPAALNTSDDWFVGAKVSVPWGPNTMNYSYTNENIAPSLTVFTPTKNAIHSVKFNILDNLASYTAAQQGEVTKGQAYADFLKNKQKAAAEVREAYFGYQESILKVKNSLSNRELYQKELEIIKEKRSMNEAQTQDVVSAKVKLASEEANYNSALVETILAVAKLNKVIGIRNYFK